MPRVPRSLLALLVPSLLAACASTPEPLPLRPPELEVHVAHYAGDPIAGPLSREAAAALELDPARALPVFGQLFVVSELPGDRFAPLTDHVRMIIAEGGAEPLAARSLVTPGTCLVTGDEAVALAESVARKPTSEAVLAATFEGLSLPGVTTALRATHAQPIEGFVQRPGDRRVGVELWRADPTDESLSIALVISDVVEVFEGLADAEPRVSRRARREKLVLDARVRGGGAPLALFVPQRFDPERRLAYVLLLEVGAAPAGEDERSALAEPLAAVRTEVQEAAAEGADRRRRLAREDRARLRSLRAIEALGEAAHRRAALIELAGAGAPIAAELALMADDAAIERLTERLLTQVDLLRELAAAPDVLAWRLEREVVLMYAEESSGGDPPPEHTSLFLQYTGEVGRYPGVLEDAIAASADGQAFRARVLEENRIALEDASPAARLRAHDWLTSNGIEVPGYDPFAGRSERGAALRAWAAAETSAAEDAAAEDGP